MTFNALVMVKSLVLVYHLHLMTGGWSRSGIRPLVCIPLSSCTITAEGTNGCDFHIEPKA